MVTDDGGRLILYSFLYLHVFEQAHDCLFIYNFWLSRCLCVASIKM